MSRYTPVAVLGEGGSGIVEEVIDEDLHRHVVRKTLREDAHKNLKARFLVEARVMAQLQHPNIVPLLDADLNGNNPWYTMPHIHGEALAHSIRRTHLKSGIIESLFRKQISALTQVALAVDYAHAQGVLHRDLKPDNILIGSRGEVYVLDWGLAKIRGTIIELDTRPHTRMGQIAGTPAYMPPEQAVGALSDLDARSDVYALGATLFAIMYGRSPYLGKPMEIIDAVLRGPPPELEPDLGATIPFRKQSRNEEAYTPPSLLVNICREAMSPEREDRPQTAMAFADLLQGYLDGLQAEADGLLLVEEARGLMPRVANYRKRSEIERRRASDMIREKVPQTEAEWGAVWKVEDEAKKLKLKASLADQEVDQILQAALRCDETLHEAHASLAQRAKRQLDQAEEEHDEVGRLIGERLLRYHAKRLYHGAMRSTYRRWLQGMGSITLHTNPQGAEVRLHRLIERNRKLVPKFERVIGHTPLQEVSVQRGSWLITLHLPGHEIVRYPIYIQRGSHWDGRPPSARVPHPVWVPKRNQLPDGAIYVPPAWAWMRGDEDSPLQRYWCPGHLIDRFQVTLSQYFVFLNRLLKSKGEAFALRYAPQLGSKPLAKLTNEGLISVPAVDRQQAPDEPVTSICRFQAVAYLAWRSKVSGRRWRLPTCAQWEHSARGVDGRTTIWGRQAAPCWANVLESGNPQHPLSIREYPEDETVYGVRGFGGNASDIMRDTMDEVKGVPWPESGNVPTPRAKASDAFYFHRGRFATINLTGMDLHTWGMNPKANGHRLFGFRGASSLKEAMKR